MGSMAADLDFINKSYQDRRQRYASRMRQGQRVRDVLCNELDVAFKDVVKADDEPVVGNLVWAAARTISQRVGRFPRITAEPDDDLDDKFRTRAEKHEKRLLDYAYRMNLQATRMQAAYWLVTHDLAPLVVHPSKDYGIPVIEVRDPMTCYPGTVWPHKPDMVDVLFADKMTAWRARSIYPQVAKSLDALDDTVEEVVLGEWFDTNGCTVVMLEPILRLLDFYPNPCPGKPMVVLTRGFSPDLDFHGQFDHVIAALIAQAKLFSLVMAYASQQVAAETVVVGEITSNQGRWATGPGAVNQITPMPGAQANKLNNNMSVQVFNELDRLERAIRLGGQFPAQLSGEPVASIATGRGLEQLTLTVDDNVGYWQTVLDDAFMRALSIVPQQARLMAAPGAGDFDEEVTLFVRSQSGADPAETVRLLQLQGAKNLSRLTVMDRLPEVDAPLQELARLDIDDMRQTLIKSLEVAIQTGQVTPDTVAQMIHERRKGKEIEEVWDDIRQIQQQQEQEAPGGSQQGNAPSLTDLLNPTRLAGQASSQGIRAARSSPESLQLGQALHGGAPVPGGPPPGPAGIPG